MPAELNVAPPASTEAADVVAWALATYGDQLVAACSFSLEDAVVIDLWSRVGTPRVFALDTGRLPEETYRCAESLRERYDLSIEWFYPDTTSVEQLLRAKGPYSFYESLENRHECCQVRKVAPLARALAGRSAWLVGLRREQSTTRVAVEPVAWDEAHGLVKVSPLADWTRERLEAYAAEHNVPVHPLHHRGYPSIGCAPCTRAVRPGEDERAGRWWWEQPEHKECGLHR